MMTSYALMLLLTSLVESILKFSFTYCYSLLSYLSYLTKYSYTRDFLQVAPGYINNMDAVNELCEYCQYSTGNEYLATLEWDVSYRWRDFGILIGYLVFNLFICVVFVYLFRKQSR